MRDSRLLLRRIRWEMRVTSELNWNLMEHFGERLTLQLASRGIGVMATRIKIVWYPTPTVSETLNAFEYQITRCLILRQWDGKTLAQEPFAPLILVLSLEFLGSKSAIFFRNA